MKSNVFQFSSPLGMPSMMLKGETLFALLSIGPTAIGKQIYNHKLAMLKLKFKTIKCATMNKVPAMSAALLTLLMS